LSRLAEFRAAEKALQEQLKQLESLKNDAGLKKEIEFEEKLQGLMKNYGKEPERHHRHSRSESGKIRSADRLQHLKPAALAWSRSIRTRILVN
jgi:hypothetical protein